MQNTTTQRKPENIGSGLGLFLLGALATALFLYTISRIGLLNIGRTAGPINPETITLATENFKFGQAELRVTAGETVELELSNADFLPHSFDVDELDIHIPIPGRDGVRLTFTPTKPGTYSFYCGIPGHVEAGMVGDLIVEP